MMPTPTPEASIVVPERVVSPEGQTRPNRRRRVRGRGRRGLANLVGLLFAAVWVFPVYWMLNTAFKPSFQITTLTPVWFPYRPTLSNFESALGSSNLLHYFINSAIVVLGAVAFSVVLGFLACAALTRFRFTGRKAILIAILFVQMVPSGALLIPLFLSFQTLGLLNSYIGLILAYVASVLPFTIWTLRGFFVAVPVELEESARVDGATTWRVLRSILLPLVMPGLISTSVFAFITAWNDYLIAYVMLKDQSMYTLPVWLASFSSATQGTNYGAVMAASVLFALPVVVFFLIVQRGIVAGMTAGAVKG